MPGKHTREFFLHTQRLFVQQSHNSNLEVEEVCDVFFGFPPLQLQNRVRGTREEEEEETAFDFDFDLIEKREKEER